jgi:hypothetical protein
MASASKGFSRALCLSLSGAALLVMSVGPTWAGQVGVPAPLLGATGPFGLLAAGAGFGGYLLYKRYWKRG